MTSGNGRRSVERKPRKAAGDVVLLTGFGPFPGVPVNATATLMPDLARRARRRFADCRFVAATLPTEWHAGLARLDQLLRRHQPLLALHFGVDATAVGFEIETQGENVCAARTDAAGQLPPLGTVIDGAARKLVVTLPVPEILAALAALGIPARASDSAGQYLCNAVLYRSLHARASEPRRMTGFIHLPPDLDAGPLSREAALAGGLEILRACLDRNGHPGPAAGGAISI